MRPVFRQFLAAVLMFIVIQSTKGIITSFSTLALNIALAMLVYFGILFILAGPELVKTTKFIIISVRNKS